jgi:hypothetical protein
LLRGVKHRRTDVETPAEFLGACKCKEYSNTAYYAGPFTIGNIMNIRVKVICSFRVESNAAESVPSRLPESSEFMG